MAKHLYNILFFIVISISHSYSVQNHKIVIGYLENIFIKEIGLSYIALIDTGATFSALHAYGISEKRINNILYVDFYTVNEKGQRTKKRVKVEDIIEIGSSMGQVQKRYSVLLNVIFGGKEYKTLFTLVNRKNIKYNVLIGRELLQGRFIVDTEKKFILKK